MEEAISERERLRFIKVNEDRIKALQNNIKMFEGYIVNCRERLVSLKAVVKS